MKLAVDDFYFIKLNNVFRAIDGNGVFVVGILGVDTIEHPVDFYLVEFFGLFFSYGSLVGRFNGGDVTVAVFSCGNSCRRIE